MQGIQMWDDSGAYVAIVLRNQLRIHLFEGDPPESIDLDGTTYVDVEKNDWRGFYDWLRSRTGMLLGVRFWPFESAEFVCDDFAQLPYVTADDRRYIEIYFTQDRDYDPESTGAQEFGNNRIMTSAMQEHAITFGTTWFSERDFEAARRISDESAIS